MKDVSISVIENTSNKFLEKTLRLGFDFFRPNEMRYLPTFLVSKMNNLQSYVALKKVVFSRLFSNLGLTSGKIEIFNFLSL